MPSMRRRSLLKVTFAALTSAASVLSHRFAWARPRVQLAGSMMGDGMGGMMGNGMGGRMGPMRTGMALFRHHNEIRRQMTVLPDGIRATTESDNPDVAALIQEHVTSMYERIDQDRPFGYPMSRTVPALFRNTGGYRRQLQLTSKGVMVTETAESADMVRLIHAHAQEITGFVDEGMPAMMRGMMMR
jgi:hypothetical protein